MAIATFLSRILGLVREQVIAFYFGASGFTDAFLVAYRIPNLLRDLFAEGAFSAAFVPSFVESNIKSKEEARKLLWALFILLGGITLVLSIAIFIFAPELIQLFAPSFKADPEKFSITVTLTRIMSPFLLLVSLAALFMGALNSLKIFFIPSLAPAFFNISMIISMLTLPSYLINHGYPAVLSLGLGVLMGGFVQALVQIPLIIKHGYGPKLPPKILNPQTAEVMKKLGPGLLGFAATQINLIVNTILASGTVVGAVSWLSFAFRLFQLPVGILSVSIGNSNLVHFSNAWKNQDKEQAVQSLKDSFFLALFLVLPAMVSLVLLSEEMIHIIFERGAFNRESTLMTSKALTWYALGLPFYSFYKITVPTFYAIDRQKIPVYCSLFSVGLNIIFCIALVPRYGFEVLAIGTSLSILLNSSLQVMLLKRDLSFQFHRQDWWRRVRLIFAAVVSSGALLLAKNSIDYQALSFMTRCLLLGFYLILIATCYFGTCVILGERELVTALIKKLRRL